MNKPPLHTSASHPPSATPPIRHHLHPPRPPPPASTAAPSPPTSAQRTPECTTTRWSAAGRASKSRIGSFSGGLVPRGSRCRSPGGSRRGGRRGWLSRRGGCGSCARRGRGGGRRWGLVFLLCVGVKKRGGVGWGGSRLWMWVWGKRMERVG